MQNTPLDPSRPHLFTPRKHGSKVACEVCGATAGDLIHVMPKRKRNDRQR